MASAPPQIHISLGENCLIDNLLKKYNMKTYSYPFGSCRSNIEYVIDIIQDDFCNFLDPRFLYRKTVNTTQELVKNNFYKQSSNIYTHGDDFEFTHHDVHLNPEHIESIKRKVSRFNALNTATNVSPVYFYYYHRTNKHTDMAKLLSAFSKFEKLIKFQNYKIIILWQKLIGSDTPYTRTNSGKYIMFECNDPIRWEGTNIGAQTFDTHFDTLFKNIKTLD